MRRTRRILAVTAGLAAAGAVTGAVCGVLALLPLFASHWLPPHPGYSLGMVGALALWAAVAGAAFGICWGPLLAWTLLPHVPLWRVILWAAAGTVVGSFYGLAAAATRLVPGLPAVFSGALLGMTAGGTFLRRRVARDSRAGPPPAAT